MGIGYSVLTRHIEKIRSAKIPASNKELQSINGRTLFYGQIIPNFVTEKLWLNDLESQDLQLTDQLIKCFQSIKQEPCPEPVIQFFSWNKEKTMTTDASEQAVGGFLSKKRLSSHPSLKEAIIS